MRRAAAAPAALAILLLVSACFYSEDELIGFWGADRAVEPGLYTHTPYDPLGEEWDRPTWQGEIAYEGRRYQSDTPDFPHPGARLKRLHEDIYIAQWPRVDGVAYAIAFSYPGILTYHQPDCSVLTGQALAEAGVEPGEEGFCRVAGLDELEAVMRAYLDALGGEVRLDGIYRRVD